MKIYGSPGKRGMAGRSKGVTLLELMIAMGILSALLGAIYGVIATAQITFQQGMVKRHAQWQIQRGIDQITQDLRESSVNATICFTFTTVSDAIFNIPPAQKGPGLNPSVLILTSTRDSGLPGVDDNALATKRNHLTGLYDIQMAPAWRKIIVWAPYFAAAPVAEGQLKRYSAVVFPAGVNLELERYTTATTPGGFTTVTPTQIILCATAPPANQVIINRLTGVMTNGLGGPPLGVTNPKTETVIAADLRQFNVIDESPTIPNNARYWTYLIEMDGIDARAQRIAMEGGGRTRNN